MKFDIKKHIYLILLFILSFTVETAQSQEVTNIHIAATDTVPTYTSDSAVINFLKDAGIPITQNSKLKLLKSGRAKFIDLFEEIRHAKHHIHLEYFNFRNDSIANALFDLLGEKVKEGVEVRALFDAFGNLSNNKPLKKKHIQAIRDKGIEFVKFDPFKFPYINHALHRDHRKIVVIDGKIGYTGGMNIANYYIKGLPEIGDWRDMHIRIEGNAVNELQDIFLATLLFSILSKSIVLSITISAPKANITSELVIPLTNPSPANNKCCPMITRPSDLKIDSFNSIGVIFSKSLPEALISLITSLIL